MALGSLAVDTLNTSTGVLATQNGMTGIAKAWVQFAGSTPTINSQFNVSSITRNGAGDYTVNFTTVMPNANYSINISCSNASSGANFFGNVTLNVATSSATTQAPTASAFRFIAYNVSNTLIDPLYVNVTVFSS
jgi:hypothetical protein